MGDNKEGVVADTAATSTAEVSQHVKVSSTQGAPPTGSGTSSTTPATHLSPDKGEGNDNVTGDTTEGESAVKEGEQRSEGDGEGGEGKGVTHTGTCKWFDSRRGFGFISPDDRSEDVFVHQQCILADGFRSLQLGEQVVYQVQRDELGRKKAVHVTGPGGAPVIGEGPGNFYRGQGGGGGGYGWYGGGGRGGYGRPGGGMGGMPYRGGYKMGGRGGQGGGGGMMYPTAFDMQPTPDFSRQFPSGYLRGYGPADYHLMPAYGYMAPQGTGGEGGYPPYPHY